MQLRRLFPSSLRALAMKRISVALLTVALLAAIVPFSVSSHGQGCSMPCCAGGSCSTGACDVSFEAPKTKAKPESHCEHGDQSEAVAIEEASRHNDFDSSELCGADNLTDVFALAIPLTIQPQQATLKSGSFSKPCSPDCRAGAASFSQLRRSRDMASTEDTHKPIGLDSSNRTRNNHKPVFLSRQLRRLSTPRAPPATPFNA